ncbi:PAS domain-containing protein [Sulfurimonas sp. MAG313]|nr:PAS domain-containing protein [Sulfurimonas sp. MAG313]MDF1880628.1 PAS domain-containing protein [Sulfurimonas sp. MAG313]
MNDEYVLLKEDFLVSQTDKKGIITFANEDFCKVAGYTLDELVGQPHNMVRHHDMPKAAFKDLWDTVKGNDIWTGYVKNSIKGGGYYWVYATVYPMDDGYMSCRRKASPDEIEAAEKLYKTMR